MRWQKGEGISLCILFTKTTLSQVYSLYQTSSHSWRAACLQGGQPRGRKYLHTGLSSWRHKLNRLFCGVKRKTPQEAVKAESDFPILTAFQRRPLLSLFLHIHIEALLQQLNMGFCSCPHNSTVALSHNWSPTLIIWLLSATQFHPERAFRFTSETFTGLKNKTSATFESFIYANCPTASNVMSEHSQWQKDFHQMWDTWQPRTATGNGKTTLNLTCEKNKIWKTVIITVSSGMWKPLLQLPTTLRNWNI